MEEFGLGDGVGFIMDFICGVVERYAGDFYIAIFMCYVGHLLASHPYRHLELCGIALTQIHNAPGGHGQEERAVPALFEREVFFRERSNFHLGTEKVHEQR